MNIEKLQDEMKKASADKASAELDRMIKIHEDIATNNKEILKRYLLSLAITPGKAAEYALTSAQGNAAIDHSRHKQIAKDLKRLKAELE